MSQIEASRAQHARGRSSGARVTTMNVVRDTPAGVLLRFPHRIAALFFVGMSGAAWACFRFIPEGPPWLLTVVLGLFLLVRRLGTIWREELKLGFASGQWRLRRGFIGRVRETRGPLAEIPDVELVLDRRSSSEDDASTWKVRIGAPAWSGPIELASVTREERGYAELEKWARRLRKDVVDRTGDRAVRTSWDVLDAPFGTAAVSGPGGPPARWLPARFVRRCGALRGIRTHSGSTLLRARPRDLASR